MYQIKFLFILLITINYLFLTINGQVGSRCTVKSNGKPGICKLSSDCPKVELLAQQQISPTFCNFHQLSYLVVCCEIDDKYTLEPNENLFINNEEEQEEDPDSSPIVYPSDDEQFQPMRISEKKCQEYSKDVTGVVEAIPLVTNTEPQIISFVKCDYNSVALIVGGKPASAGEFPFMAALGFEVGNTIEWRCGATLISDEFVLTAAHCTFSRDADAPKVIRLGDLDLSSTNDNTIYADYDIKEIIVHPQYRYPQKYNDISLIRSTKKIKFTKYIRPACLYHKTIIEQSQAIATGWGKTDYAASEISNKLLKVPLNIYNNQQCSQTYRGNKYLPRGIVSTMLCAGELKGGRDTCQGDSGGPLLITKKDNQCKFYIIGITSFGKSCGQAYTPAVYTKVSEYVSWIEGIVW